MLINQKINLQNYIERSIEQNNQYKEISEILLKDPDESLLTPEQIKTYKKLGKMTIMKIINNSNILIDFCD